MALFTLIDPAFIDELQATYMEPSDGKTDIITNITMTEKEKDGIFFGLCIVVGI